MFVISCKFTLAGNRRPEADGTAPERVAVRPVATRTERTGKEPHTGTACSATARKGRHLAADCLDKVAGATRRAEAAMHRSPQNSFDVTLPRVPQVGPATA